MTLLASASAIAAAIPIYALAAPDVSRAPDLRADPVELIQGPAVYSDTEAGLGAQRLLVRFDGFVTNVGDGPLEIRGNPQKPQSDAGGVKQYVLSPQQVIGSLPSEPAPADVGSIPVVQFETADSHDHFHLMRVMRYSLWNLDRTAEVAPGQKVGFCLYDLQVAPNPPSGITPDPRVYTDNVTHFCEYKNPDSTSLRMGVSSGWRDIYDKSLAFQWIDVSDTSPGTYLVASQADPGNTVWEGGGAAEVNPRAFSASPVTVPGWVARPATVSQTGDPQSITLPTLKFGNPGAAVYDIVSGPEHGTLDQVAGGAVTYRPAAGYTGPDSFSFTARDASSTFPGAGSRPRATVTINAAVPGVTISGAPSSLIAGTSAQLTARVLNAPGGVSWTTTAGAVSADGLFIAPATPPPGGVVTVRATSTEVSDLSAQVQIAISPVPVAQPAPLPTPPTITAVRRLLSGLTLSRAGSSRILVATVTTGPKAGRVIISMTVARRVKGALGTRVLGRCGARVGTDRTVSCRITVPRGVVLTKVRATATIALAGRISAVRRAGLRR